MKFVILFSILALSMTAQAARSKKKDAGPLMETASCVRLHELKTGYPDSWLEHPEGRQVLRDCMQDLGDYLESQPPVERAPELPSSNWPPSAEDELNSSLERGMREFNRSKRQRRHREHRESCDKNGGASDRRCRR